MNWNIRAWNIRAGNVRAAAVTVALGLLAWGVVPLAAVGESEVPQGTWPVGSTSGVTVKRGFDAPSSPYGRGHRGVDLPVAPGSVVKAAAAGTVTFAGQLAGRGVVVVDHGSVRTTYEPVDAQVAVGTTVSAGSALGTLGRYVVGGAHCAESCLHWGLRRGDTYLDPLSMINAAAAPGSIKLLPGRAKAAVLERAKQQSSQEIGVGPGGNNGFLMPVGGPITSKFGPRFHPILKVRKLHDGTDFGASCGTPIRAPYDGTVSGGYYNRGYGNRLFLDHGTVKGRRVTTTYNHAERYVVSTGMRVRKGQLIGYAGTTGYSTGCHLHLMVELNGKLVDPMSWF